MGALTTMAFDEMRKGLHDLGKLIDESNRADAEKERLRLIVWEIKDALNEYSSIHLMMAPRVLSRGYIITFSCRLVIYEKHCHSPFCLLHHALQAA